MEAQTSETETRLTEIWSKLLKVQTVRRDDNFFELGGQSQQAMAVLDQVGEQLHVRLPMTAIFRYPTVQEMAKLIDAGAEELDEIEDLGP